MTPVLASISTWTSADWIAVLGATSTCAVAIIAAVKGNPQAAKAVSDAAAAQASADAAHARLDAMSAPAAAAAADPATQPPKKGT